MNQRKIRTIILIALGIFIAFSILNYDNLNFNAGNSDGINFDNENIKISAVSGKIHIDNNWTAAEIAGICTGNGIYSDPYIIENLVIDGEGSGSCILIENSNVFFKIENCTVYNSGFSDDAGIRLLYVNNSQLINNNCTSNYRGLSLFSSDNNTISGNIANYNLDDGIFIHQSDYNTVSGNTTNYNKHYGMYIRHSNNDTISGNTANNNIYDGIYLVSSYDFTISGNTANYNIKGINLAYSHNNTISGNTANYNDYGIYLFDSDSNTISGNNLVGNDVCTYEDENSNSNVFENNDCGEGISGYNLFFLLGILSVVAIFISKKIKKPKI